MVHQHKHIHLQEWLEILYWRQQGFFTLKLTHRNVSKNKKRNMAHILPRDMLLRQIYSILVSLSSTTSLSLSYTKHHTQKACNHTRGDSHVPLQLVTLFWHSCLNQRTPRYYQTHTHWNTCTSSRGGAVCKWRKRVKKVLWGVMWQLVLWN